MGRDSTLRAGGMAGTPAIQIISFSVGTLFLMFALVACLRRLFLCIVQNNRTDEETNASAEERSLQESLRISPLVPLPPEIQKAMPRFVYRSQKAEVADITCAICLAEYAEREEILTLPCSHCFHGECVTLWFQFHSTCPTCRRLLSPGPAESKEEGALVAALGDAGNGSAGEERALALESDGGSSVEVCLDLACAADQGAAAEVPLSCAQEVCCQIATEIAEGEENLRRGMREQGILQEQRRQQQLQQDEQKAVCQIQHVVEVRGANEEALPVTLCVSSHVATE